jgi:dCMP deaminase
MLRKSTRRIEMTSEERRIKIFMTMAYLVAMQSKDNRTKIGAVVVGPDNEVRSTGYNGQPRGCDDEEEKRLEHPEKYFWFEHAERNAIYNAARMGLSTKGCTMYTMGIPCADCARAVIQSGIDIVVYDHSWNDKNTDKWKESIERSKKMFTETGVELFPWFGNPLQLAAVQHGERIKIAVEGFDKED